MEKKLQMGNISSRGEGNQVANSASNIEQGKIKYYFYALLFALILIIGSSVRLFAQTTPSGSANMSNNAQDNRPNYNYLGLLGLLGLYGLHKKQLNDKRISIDRKAA